MTILDATTNELITVRPASGQSAYFSVEVNGVAGMVLDRQAFTSIISAAVEPDDVKAPQSEQEIQDELRVSLRDMRHGKGVSLGSFLEYVGEDE